MLTRLQGTKDLKIYGLEKISLEEKIVENRIKTVLRLKTFQNSE